MKFSASWPLAQCLIKSAGFQPGLKTLVRLTSQSHRHLKSYDAQDEPLTISLTVLEKSRKGKTRNQKWIEKSSPKELHKEKLFQG